MAQKSQNANMQDALKFLALIIMMIDHYSMYLEPYNQLYRTIGRFAFPIFAYYAGYNFHEKIRHQIWILGAILIGLHLYIIQAFVSNILVTLALGQLYLFYAGKSIIANERVFFRHFIAMLLLTPITYSFIDYGTLGIAIMTVGYRVQHLKKDDGYLFLAIICTMIFNEYIMFEVFHNLPYSIMSIVMETIAALCLKYINNQGRISINLKPITRNMLYIYFISIVMFIFLMKYNYYQ